MFFVLNNKIIKASEQSIRQIRLRIIILVFLLTVTWSQCLKTPFIFVKLSI